MAAPAIAIWCASHAFFYVADIEPLYVATRPILSLVAPLLLLALLVPLGQQLAHRWRSRVREAHLPVHCLARNFLWLSLNYFSGASVAALLLPYLQGDQPAFLRVAGILLPLLLISYLTFKTALGRVEDANRHLSELNRLYLSTIETLAMAIDAKDQITHGHIRRVQHYAIGLAKRVGISDPTNTRDRSCIAAARHGQVGYSRIHPEQTRKAHTSRIRENEASCQRRSRHSIGHSLSLSSRANRAPSPRELGRHRIPRPAKGRGDPHRSSNPFSCGLL